MDNLKNGVQFRELEIAEILKLFNQQGLQDEELVRQQMRDYVNGLVSQEFTERLKECINTPVAERYRQQRIKEFLQLTMEEYGQIPTKNSKNAIDYFEKLQQAKVDQLFLESQQVDELLQQKIFELQDLSILFPTVQQASILQKLDNIHDSYAFDASRPQDIADSIKQMHKTNKSEQTLIRNVLRQKAEDRASSYSHGEVPPGELKPNVQQSGEMQLREAQQDEANEDQFYYRVNQPVQMLSPEKASYDQQDPNLFEFQMQEAAKIKSEIQSKRNQNKSGYSSSTYQQPNADSRKSSNQANQLEGGSGEQENNLQKMQFIEYQEYEHPQQHEHLQQQQQFSQAIHIQDEQQVMMQQQEDQRDTQAQSGQNGKQQLENTKHQGESNYSKNILPEFNGEIVNSFSPSKQRFMQKPEFVQKPIKYSPNLSKNRTQIPNIRLPLPSQMFFEKLKASTNKNSSNDQQIQQQQQQGSSEKKVNPSQQQKKSQNSSGKKQPDIEKRGQLPIKRTGYSPNQSKGKMDCIKMVRNAKSQSPNSKISPSQKFSPDPKVVVYGQSSEILSPEQREKWSPELENNEQFQQYLIEEQILKRMEEYYQKQHLTKDEEHMIFNYSNGNKNLKNGKGGEKQLSLKEQDFPDASPDIARSLNQKFNDIAKNLINQEEGANISQETPEQATDDLHSNGKAKKENGLLNSKHNKSKNNSKNNSTGQKPAKANPRDNLQIKTNNFLVEDVMKGNKLVSSLYSPTVLQQCGEVSLQKSPQSDQEELAQAFSQQQQQQQQQRQPLSSSKRGQNSDRSSSRKNSPGKKENLEPSQVRLTSIKEEKTIELIETTVRSYKVKQDILNLLKREQDVFNEDERHYQQQQLSSSQPQPQSPSRVNKSGVSNSNNVKNSFNQSIQNYNNAQQQQPQFDIAQQSPSFPQLITQQDIQEIEDFILELDRSLIQSGGIVNKQLASKLNEIIKLKCLQNMKKFKKKNSTKSSNSNQSAVINCSNMQASFVQQQQQQVSVVQEDKRKKKLYKLNDLENSMKFDQQIEKQLEGHQDKLQEYRRTRQLLARYAQQFTIKYLNEQKYGLKSDLKTNLWLALITLIGNYSDAIPIKNESLEEQNWDVVYLVLNKQGQIFNDIKDLIQFLEKNQLSPSLYDQYLEFMKNCDEILELQNIELKDQQEIQLIKFVYAVRSFIDVLISRINNQSINKKNHQFLIINRLTSFKKRIPNVNSKKNKVLAKKWEERRKQQQLNNDQMTEEEKMTLEKYGINFQPWNQNLQDLQEEIKNIKKLEKEERWKVEKEVIKNKKKLEKEVNQDELLRNQEAQKLNKLKEEVQEQLKKEKKEEYEQQLEYTKQLKADEKQQVKSDNERIIQQNKLDVEFNSQKRKEEQIQLRNYMHEQSKTNTEDQKRLKEQKLQVQKSKEKEELIWQKAQAMLEKQNALISQKEEILKKLKIYKNNNNN